MHKDVKNALYIAHLKEKISIDQPQGSIDRWKDKWVYRLHESVQGSCQAYHEWLQDLDRISKKWAV